MAGAFNASPVVAALRIVMLLPAELRCIALAVPKAADHRCARLSCSRRRAGNTSLMEQRQHSYQRAWNKAWSSRALPCQSFSLSSISDSARPRPVAEAQEDGASSMEAELCAAASGSEIKHEPANMLNHCV